MLRLPVLVLLALCGFAVPVFAAESFEPAAPEQAAQAGPQAPLSDLFTVENMRVDATAESATLARDLAMAQGRPQALSILLRRFTATANWGKEPQLDDNQILRMIRSFEVNNERRSTTRYLADVTFHFNPAAVRQFLRRSDIPYTDTRSPPALVIPVYEDASAFDPLSPWAMAWGNPALQLGLVPVMLPQADIPELDVLKRPDLTQADWAAVTPLAQRYGVEQVVLAIASEDGNSVQMVDLSMMVRRAGSFAYAQSTFEADAEAVMDRLNEAWKTRSAIDFGLRSHLLADVQFGSLADWARIRTQLGGIRAVTELNVKGLAVSEAQIDLTYFGRPEQLIDAMAQQNLDLSGSEQNYTLQLRDASAANADNP